MQSRRSFLAVIGAFLFPFLATKAAAGGDSAVHGFCSSEFQVGDRVLTYYGPGRIYKIDFSKSKEGIRTPIYNIRLSNNNGLNPEHLLVRRLTPAEVFEATGETDLLDVYCWSMIPGFPPIPSGPLLPRLQGSRDSLVRLNGF